MDGSGEIIEFRAAQYVRMSTEHQKYLTHNQSDKIHEYAEKRGIEIIKTPMKTPITNTSVSAPV